MTAATLNPPDFADSQAPQPYGVEALRLLDDPAEWSTFSHAHTADDQVWTSSVVVEGMYCAACASTIEDALAAVPGVIDARVSAASHRAQIVWSAATVRPSVWLQAIQRVGYRAVPANDVFALEHRRKESRKALWRWLVAGLCMMQVMMYAYPAYVAHPGDLSAEMEQLLRWASWVLSLPVILFSCGPFFRSALRDLVAGRIGMDLPVSLGILITFGVSGAGTFEPEGPFGHEVFFDSLTMFVFFLLSGRWLELRLRDRTAGALEALMNRLPDSVERQSINGGFERVAARRVTVADLLRVLPGETFCADGVIEQGETLVDEALLTGESRPVTRNLGSRVVAGSHNLSATVLVRVEQVRDGTRFAQIVQLMESAASSRPQVAQLADRLAKPFLVAVLVAAVGACAFWWSSNPVHALMVAVAVLVVTCPCALSLATPAAMLASAGRLARSGILVRNLQALEALSRVDTVVFDKTGTLTSDSLSIGPISTRSGIAQAQVLQMAAALAAHSLHPVARALHLAASLRLADARGQFQCDGVSETSGAGITGVAHRPGHVAEAASQTLRLGSAQFCGVTDRGEGASAVHLCDQIGWLASFELVEALRADAVATVRALQRLDIDVQLLSGDGQSAVSRIASCFEAAGGAGAIVARGECSPADKLANLRELQHQGHRVAMVGDGLNDGPVLAGAQVSFAFGKAVPLAQARSDFVVLGDRLDAVLDAVRVARASMRVVRQNLWWALAYNAACVPLAVLGWLPAWLAGLGMASSSLLVVVNSLRLSGGRVRL
jgi:Cu2+-exporting ATPase